ncbi:hypothetical protein BDR04DRAFT_1100767 [Suillus decipiens]|nr:hypothetical protein BDR04DRAFT_1100767 [Suillus decipiens]
MDIIDAQSYFSDPSTAWWYICHRHTSISNDPAWWPAIDAYRVISYFIVAAFAGVTYDWMLTFGQEVELIWVSRVSSGRNMHDDTLNSRGNGGL